MSQKKKFKSSAERQKAYRDRKRNAKVTVTPQISAVTKPVMVTEDGHPYDLQYIGDFGFGPVYARWIHPKPFS